MKRLAGFSGLSVLGDLTQHGPVAGGFSPASISGLRLWLAARLEAYSNGDVVSPFHDQSGNGNHGTRVNADSIFHTGVLNGQPAVTLDNGSGGFSTPLSLAKPYTIFLAELSIVEAGNTRTINSGTNNCLISPARIDGNSCYVQGTVSGYNAFINPHIVALRIGASVATYRVDGVNRTTNSGQVADWGSVYLGWSPATGEPGNTKVAEVIAYDAALSDADVILLENYLNGFYAAF